MTRANETDVLLVSMPYAPLSRPSLGISLLKSLLVSNAFSCSLRYFHLDWAEHIGPALYGSIANGEPSHTDLVGEWTFAQSLFPNRQDLAHAYQDRILGRHTGRRFKNPKVTDSIPEAVLDVRSKADSFLDHCIEDIQLRQPKIVGLTSTFQQNMASLALARRLRVSFPDLPIILGGANCEGIMGWQLARSFPFLTAVVSGEGETVIVDLVSRLLSGETIADVPSTFSHDSPLEKLKDRSRESTRNLDWLPIPDYTEFFSEYKERTGRSLFPKPELLVETSRGCWWGEKHHCTFCGLNAGNMRFRSKSPERALEEIVVLLERYGPLGIAMTDNILDMKYVRSLMPELKKLRSSGVIDKNLSLFYETKANLKRDEIRALAHGGVTRIQPGIESFSDSVLRLMKKGVTALQNIQCLKWCKELGVTPFWNVIWGFPGEEQHEYKRMARLVPLLTHLPPPHAYGMIHLDRFSPNFEDGESLGFHNIRPPSSHPLVYGIPADELKNLSYYFEFDYAQPQPWSEYTRDLAVSLETWQKEYSESDLFSVAENDALVIFDLRRATGPRTIGLHGMGKRLYEACTVVCRRETLHQIGAGDGTVDPEQVEKFIDRLIHLGLVIEDGGRLVALPLEMGEYSPAPKVIERLTCELGREDSTDDISFHPEWVEVSGT